jgi:hypothetical protein
VTIDDTASYAMGWVVFPFADAVKDAGDPVPTAVSHGGAWAGFQATTVLIPGRDLGVVVLANKSDPDFYNLGWNISLLALGLEPRDYPTANFTARYGRSLLAGVILLLGAGLFWSLHKIRSLSMQKDVDAKQRRKLIVQMSLLALVDLVLAGWLLFIKLPQDNDTLALALRFNPDIGLMYILLLVLTLGWGFFRIGLLFLVLSRKGNLPQGQV